jgi:hypothetical protein
MKFTPIDWSVYNKPPYFPQWLSRGETKKLVSYDDGMLADIDRQIGLLSNQYDLDVIKGAFLDRMGNLLGEDRNGNVDKIYRMFLKLRTMLNTADGTVNDIIKVIKFIYSCREVKIAPDYPAGLVIEYAGEEQDYFDYNAILAQVVAAGVGFHTRAMFDFIEDPIKIEDGMLIDILARFVETPEIKDGPFSMISEFSFADHVLARSDVVYGGLKEFDRYNGVHIHNGKTAFQGYGWEAYNGVYLHNGKILFKGGALKYRHNGTVLFGTGFRSAFAYDDFAASIMLDFSDAAPMQEKLEITAAADHADRFPTSQIYNGKMNHDGAYRWDASNDVFEAEQINEARDRAVIGEGSVEAELLTDFADSAAAMGDAAETAVMLDLEDGASMDEEFTASVNTDFSDQVSMSDEFVVGMIGYWKYGGAPVRSHDGSISFSYGVLVEI